MRTSLWNVRVWLLLAALNGLLAVAYLVAGRWSDAISPAAIGMLSLNIAGYATDLREARAALSARQR